MSIRLQDALQKMHLRFDSNLGSYLFDWCNRFTSGKTASIRRMEKWLLTEACKTSGTLVLSSKSKSEVRMPASWQIKDQA